MGVAIQVHHLVRSLFDLFGVKNNNWSMPPFLRDHGNIQELINVFY